MLIFLNALGGLVSYEQLEPPDQLLLTSIITYLPQYFEKFRKTCFCTVTWTTLLESLELSNVSIILILS